MQARTRHAPSTETEARLDGGFRLVAVMAAMMAVLLVMAVLRGPTDQGAVGAATAHSPSPAVPVDPASFLVDPVRPAPPLALTAQDSTAFSLADLRGSPAFVFFGYTHCPDVCPATTGTIGLAMDEIGPGARAVFVTVDPARDTTEWLDRYVRFLPTGFVGLTGTEDRIAETAAAWGVRYARVETGDPAAYSMAHTADVFLVDPAGDLRAVFPFGTNASTVVATYRSVMEGSTSPQISSPGATQTPSAAVSADPSGIPATALDVTMISSSVWSGPPSPLIVTLAQGGTALDDLAARPIFQLQDPVTSEPVGRPVAGTAIRPRGVADVFYVAPIEIADPGQWRLSVMVDTTTGPAEGTALVTAMDPGSTPGIGSAAPTTRTPTLDDVGGVLRAVTTDPAPDPRLSRWSTTDALSDGTPFVLVIDSAQFRVSPACGRALVMAKYLVDRWPTVRFIHLEPYLYDIVTDTAVLRGSLDDPRLNEPAERWGIGAAPWGPKSMPWVFIVDARGGVRAAFQGVFGTAEVDVVLSLIGSDG